MGSNVVDCAWSGARDVRPEDITCTIYPAMGIDYTAFATTTRSTAAFAFAKDGTYKPNR
jgi:hypothetical protein